MRTDHAERIGTIVSRVFEAADEDDLDNVLDALLADEELYALQESLRGLLAFDDVIDAIGSFKAKAPRARIPRRLRSLFADGLRILEVLNGALLGFAGYLQMTPNAAAEFKRSVDQAIAARQKDGFQLGPLWFLSDKDLPVEFMKGHLARERAEILLVAIVQVFHRQARPWLVEALLLRWVRDEKAYLAVLACLPGTNVPEVVLPLSERLNVAGVLEKHHASRMGYKQLLAEARRLDADVHPPPISDDE